MHDWKQKMDQARGVEPIDLVFHNARLVNVFSGEIHVTDIGIHQGYFVGLGQFNLAKDEIDLEGKKYVVPGLIDGHVHLESSLLCPEEFCAILLSRGVTTAVLDPHEIANVQGKKGIRYILDAVAPLPFNAYITLPSCVPATALETSGAYLKAEDLEEFVDHPRVIGLGEVMNYPGVLNSNPALIKKLELPLRFRDGHAPGISAQDLNAYYQAGIHTDHECSTVQEALERLRRGFYIMMREGSTAKNLHSLLPVLNSDNAGQCLFVTDDRNVLDLLEDGSIDYLLRTAIKCGVTPVRAVQMGTLNAARAIGLERHGAVAPGYQADFIILSDLEKFVIEEVYWKGKRQSHNGVAPAFLQTRSSALHNTVHLGSWSKEKLKIPVNSIPNANLGEELKTKIRVIGVYPNTLTTTCEVRELPFHEGQIHSDSKQRIAKIAVIERHHATSRTGVGFVQGIGLRKGAIASSVAHDSHNLIVVGMSDEEMEFAVRICESMGGGLVLVEGNKILGTLALPIAGLMTDKPRYEVAQQLQDLHLKAGVLGVPSDMDPFMTLAFLSLPVIPELKLTDWGLIDVRQQKVVSPIL
jgi:adenine deaminase